MLSHFRSNPIRTNEIGDDDSWAVQLLLHNILILYY